MANLFRLKTGAYRITITRGELQKSIHLGKVNKKTAETVLSMVERIVASTAAGVSQDAETARWTASIDDALHGKLVKAEVLSERQRRTLGTFIADYIAERTDWKERTVAAFSTSKNLMLGFFGENTPVDKISTDAAVAFRLKLQKKYSEATIAKIIKHCRQVFNLARRRKLIADSPFETVKSGSRRNPDRLYFVSAEETQALIDACNSPKQRLIIALARYGGLRCPSELAGLKWSEVNWERSRFIVHSPKTEGQGKATRTVPIFGELYPFFREAFETAPEGVDRVFPEITAKKSLGSFIEKTATRAGVVLWVKPFQNMRSSRATELIDDYPAHIVNAWLGHTEAVAMAHYRQSTGKAAEKFYEQAAEQRTKKVKEFTKEHAGIGCFGVEVGENTFVESFAFSPTIQRLLAKCTAIQTVSKMTPLGRVGLEPTT